MKTRPPEGLVRDASARRASNKATNAHKETSNERNNLFSGPLENQMCEDCSPFSLSVLVMISIRFALSLLLIAFVSGLYIYLLQFQLSNFHTQSPIMVFSTSPFDSTLHSINDNKWEPYRLIDWLLILTYRIKWVDDWFKTLESVIYLIINKYHLQ